MSKIVLQDNKDALQVYFLDQKSAKAHSQKKLFERVKFSGGYKQAFLDVSGNCLYIGTGFDIKNRTADPYAVVQWYELGAKIAQAASGTKINELVLQNPSTKCSAGDLEKLVLGVLQASWHYDEYLDKKSAKTNDLDVFISPKFGSIDNQTLKEVISSVSTLNSAVKLTRSIVDEPPETLHPLSAAELVKNTFKGYANANVKVYDEKWLAEQGMDGILFVGRGSRYQPRLVHVVVKPKGEVKRRVVIVGKGLTYDSGGMDIKTDGHMKTMKMDMAGAATMLGVTKAVAEIGLKNTELHWLSAFAENMIGPNSYKADDIIRTYSGQTVEVHNTDAEGRLTLADVLAYATTLEPDCIIDAATLTGAAIVALSERYTALMGNNDEFNRDLLGTFVGEGEYTVNTPMPEVLREAVQGEISDLINTATIQRQAGHITAGLFLSHFVNQNNFRNPKLKIKKPVDVPWIHLDIAGSAYNEGKNGLGAKGATGQSVRSLVTWITTRDGETLDYLG